MSKYWMIPSDDSGTWSAGGPYDTVKEAVSDAKTTWDEMTYQPSDVASHFRIDVWESETGDYDGIDFGIDTIWSKVYEHD